MFIWTGIFLIITILAGVFGFRKKKTLLQKYYQFSFWISLCLFLTLLVVCVLHITYIVSEGRKEQSLIQPSQNSAKQTLSHGDFMTPDIKIDKALVHRLLAAQFPQWADLPLEQIASAGTDNIIFRLGDEMAIRLPGIPSAALQVEKELKWLPVLAKHLPLTIPVPLAAGKPTKEYPRHWSIVPSIKGETAILERIESPREAAIALGEFVAKLQSIDATGGPLGGEHNSFRGVPLAVRDEDTRKAIASLSDIIDADSLILAWDEALLTPAWSGKPVWIHGDLYSGNMIAERGRLKAVIDFGLLGVGDPACDLMVAWTLLPKEVRDDFRKSSRCDDETWARGRGWALSFGVIALAYYLNTNLTLAGTARYAIDQILAEYKAL